MPKRSQERRLARNDRSLQGATHHREEWSADEVAFLLDWDRSDEELTIVAECLGRTREACRERYYKVRRGQTPAPVNVKGTIVTSGIGGTTQTYIGSSDDPDDQWWSPDYYRK